MFPMLMFPVSGSVMERLERRQRYADAMRKAMRRYYGHLNDACADMNVKPSNLDAALNGDRGLPVGFLEMPLGFMAWWAIYLLDVTGIPREIKHGARVMFGLLGSRRLARAEMPAATERVKELA
jgi:hypothetical protein